MDIVFRAAAAFFFIFLLTRVIGRRELSTLEPFDLILLVMLGDLVQQGVTQNDFSVTGLMLAGGTVGILTVAVSFRRPIVLPATVAFAEAPASGDGLHFAVRDARKQTPHLEGSVAFAANDGDSVQPL